MVFKKLKNMAVVENSKHTVILNTFKNRFTNVWNKYKIFEYCSILEEKEEVIHADCKSEIIKKYNLI